MKRREFILTTTGLAALGLSPKSLSGNVLFSQEGNFSEAYDDNKVVRVYDRRVSNYDFAGISVYWKTIDMNILKQMLSKSLFEISGEKNGIKAWKKILTGTKTGDLSKRKVVIKVNFNNTIRDIHATLNNSPAMMSTLAYSLMDAGMHQENICFFDCSRPFPEEFKKEIRENKLEQVVMLGRDDSITESDQKIILSDNRGILIDNKPVDLYPIPQCLIDADYLINLHLVKIHFAGVTGAMKNLFGLSKNVAFYMHHKTIKSYTESNHLPDISLNSEIRKRARLNIAEFIFGGHSPDTIDKFTNEEFFPGGIPASLIVSRNPFYHDTVLYGFIKAEYETCIPSLKRFQVMGPDTWLKNSAKLYPTWEFSHAEFINTSINGMPSKDLRFEQIEFVSVQSE